MEQTWDLITNVILIASLTTLAVFITIGIYQWIKRKSFAKIDPELRWATIPIILMVTVYFIFDHFIILATRPNGSGEPSFPSSHVMFIATIFLLTAVVIPKYVNSKAICAILDIIMLILIILTAIGRVLANMHWPSDVVGGLAFATTFVIIYYFLIKKLTKGAKHA